MPGKHDGWPVLFQGRQHSVISEFTEFDSRTVLFPSPSPHSYHIGITDYIENGRHESDSKCSGKVGGNFSTSHSK